MIQYRCDMCKCELDPKHDVAYVVRMEVYPMPSEANSAIDNDRDYLEDIQEILQRYHEFEADGELPEHDTYSKLQLDLCRNCCERFMQPLGRNKERQLDFSKSGS